MSDHNPAHEEESAGAPISGRPPMHQEHWSYLLRIWRTGDVGGWRASLQSIPEGERHMFADLESLVAFLLSVSR